MILCKNGHTNPDGATYCAVCHTYISSTESPAETPSGPPEPQSAPTAAQPAVALSHASLAVVLGERVTCDVLLQNPGGVPDEYTIEVTGEPAAWALVDPWHVSLDPGATETAVLTFMPSPSTTPRDSVPFEVKVASRQLVDQPASVQGTLEITAPVAPVAEPAPPRAPVDAAAPAGAVAAVESVRGTVGGLEERMEWGTVNQAPMTIFTFRVQVDDDQGRPVAFIPVEMRANSFHGALSDGDRVEIDASWRQGETVETKRVRNATTGGTFEAKRSHRWLIGLLVLALFIVVVVVGAGVALWQLHEHNKLCQIHAPIVSKCT